MSLAEDAAAPDGSWTPDEIMTVAAARALSNEQLCFVGIGLPNLAANLALRLHAPHVVLIYESGPIGARPTRPPLSIGDGDLAETALTVVTLPEIFNYWLQPGRIDLGFLGAAQIDQFGNLNSTMIGTSYTSPAVRLPGAGGAPEIASACGEVMVLIKQSRRTFVERVDFVTSVGHVDGPGGRERLGLRGGGPTRVVTDLGEFGLDEQTSELVLTRLHPGIELDEAIAATGWDLKVSAELSTTPPPTDVELSTLRDLVKLSESQDGA